MVALAAPEVITVVSGLPRSGTSLLMQVLEAAGLELARDELRPADPDNPRGYHELDAVRRIRAEAGFLAGCRGQVVKVVAPLVVALPDVHRYRVLFVERSLAEILASQRTMLARRGGTGAGRPGAGEASVGAHDEARDEAMLARAFEGALAQSRAWLAARPAIETLFVDHAELVARPAAAVDRIAAFLAKTGAEGVCEPDLPAALEALAATRAAMARVVDPRLHRQRAKSASPAA